MSDATTDYITRREFDATTRYYDRALTDMSRSANEHAAGVKDELRRLTDLIKERAAPQDSTLAQAAHRMLDELPRLTGSQRAGNPSRLIAIAVICAAGAWTYHLIVGHW